MAEAEELCERLAIVDHGRILAIGTPDELKRRVQSESIFRFELDRLDGGPAVLARLPGVVSAVTPSDGGASGGEIQKTVAVNLVLAEDSALGGVVAALGGLGARIVSLRKSEPSLEDVFVELVGRGFEDAAPGDVATAAGRPGEDGNGARLANGDADPRPANVPRETNEPIPEEMGE